MLFVVAIISVTIVEIKNQNRYKSHDEACAYARCVVMVYIENVQV